jgi:hypothetical protein
MRNTSRAIDIHSMDIREWVVKVGAFEDMAEPRRRVSLDREDRRNTPGVAICVRIRGLLCKVIKKKPQSTQAKVGVGDRSKRRCVLRRGTRLVDLIQDEFRLSLPRP